MMIKIENVQQATVMWVETFNEIPRDMLKIVFDNDNSKWQEVTLPTVGDNVYIEILDEVGEVYENSHPLIVKVEDGEKIMVSSSDIKILHEDILPSWGTLWSMSNPSDIRWLESEQGLKATSDCGFRIFKHEDFGLFFGIDGGGYDFYSEHWIPLYKARGLRWV